MDALHNIIDYMRIFFFLFEGLSSKSIRAPLSLDDKDFLHASTRFAPFSIYLMFLFRHYLICNLTRIAFLYDFDGIYIVNHVYAIPSLCEVFLYILSLFPETGYSAF